MSALTSHTAASFPLASLPPATFSLAEYGQMVESGAFAGKKDKSVELLWGRLVDMPPIGPGHSNTVDVLAEWSIRATLDEPIRIRIQNPIRLPSSESCPEPDVCWVRQRDYSKQHPGPDDVLLVIEIADSSLVKDRQSKLAAYAQAGIQEYWIVNLAESQVEVFRQPQAMTYTESLVLRGDDEISPLALPTAVVTANRLLAKTSH